MGPIPSFCFVANLIKAIVIITNSGMLSLGGKNVVESAQTF